MSESIDLFGREFPGCIALALTAVFPLMTVALRVVVIAWRNNILRGRDRLDR